MPSNFVRPETVTLHLSDGNSITIRKRLNVGEERARLKMFTDTDGKPVPFEHRLATIVAHLLDWTIVDDNGRKVDIAEKTPLEMKAVLDGLQLWRFKEIGEAIEAHVDAMEKELEEERSRPFTESERSPTSKSPGSLAGLSTTSVN